MGGLKINFGKENQTKQPLLIVSKDFARQCFFYCLILEVLPLPDRNDLTKKFNNDIKNQILFLYTVIDFLARLVAEPFLFLSGDSNSSSGFDF